MRSPLTRSVLSGLLGLAVLTPVRATGAFGPDPTLVKGQTIRYRCIGGEIVQAQYYRLSDDTLSFVRLRLPDGQQLTLPRVASGSGARYSADQQHTWWSKGQGGFLQERDGQGHWRIALNACEAQHGSRPGKADAGTRMSRQLRSRNGAAINARRKAVAEPVNGPAMEGQGAR